MSQSFGGNFRSNRGPRTNNHYSSRNSRFSRPPERRSPAKPAEFIERSRYVQPVQTLQEQTPVVITNSFADFGFTAQLQSNIDQHGYTQPTPIQDQTIPLLMAGRDVVGIANTGTGKTAAFLLPLINKVALDLTQGAMIVAPTRELAVQIVDEFKAFVKGFPIGHCLCIGGQSMQTQIMRLRENPHFVIGTPGRIKDLLQRGELKTELFTTIVLDEVDRMLDIGFRKDILFLISQLPKDRHAAFFSATLNRDTENVMKALLVNPVKVSVKTHETNHHIQQDVVKLRHGESKVDALHNLLTKPHFEKVIVFGRTKHGINKLEEQLRIRGISVCAIHGNKSQSARQRSLQDFKRGQAQALLATDIASRGIDVQDVTHVINYDEPACYDDYVHRIGRTGRAGKVGNAITFVVG